MNRKIVKIFFYLLLLSSLFLIIYQHNLLFGTFLLFLSIIIYIVLVPPAIVENPADNGPVLETAINPGASVLLVLSSGNKTSEDNCEEEWINILKKECGYFSTLRITEKFLLSQIEAGLIFFSSEALKEISSSPLLLKNLEALARNDGYTIFLESPDSSYEFLTGVVTGPEEYLNMEDIVISRRDEIISNLPSLNEMLPFRSVLTTTDDSNINLSSGNKCLMFCRKIGKGNIVTIFFCLSKWRRTIAFGAHSNETLTERRLKSASNLKHFQTADLSIVKNRKLEEKPFLDIIERFVIEKSADISCTPLWWYYPDCAQSSAILTFDEDYCGDEIKVLLNEIIPERIKFTTFLMSSTPASEDTLKLIEDRKGETGIHWNRFNFHITGSGLHYERDRKLKTQTMSLASLLKKGLSFSSRIHYLLCDYNPFKTIDILNEASLIVDSSWGPGRNMGGYIFGTGFPYHAPGDGGKLNPLYEFPFEVHDPHGNLSESDIVKLLGDSSEKYHSPLVLLFHPHYCIGNGESSQKLASIIKYIEKQENLWTTSIKDFIDFYCRRNESKINCKMDKKTLEIECDVKVNGLSLNIPMPDDIIKLEVDNKNISSVTISGRKILNLAEGKHLIRVGYKDE